MNLHRNSTASPIRSGIGLAEFQTLDAKLAAIGEHHGAAETSFPTLISGETLRRAEYQAAFPHLLMGATTSASPDASEDKLFAEDNLTAPAWFLSPAVCYHAYASLAERVLEQPVAIGSRGTCFRNEERTIEVGRRQIEFQMREIVLLGDAEWIEGKIAKIRSAIEALARQLGFEARWEVANDPFFLPVASGKAKMQQLLETKHELVIDTPQPLAIASINRHGHFFGDRFRIFTSNQQTIETACVAFGLDRWLRFAPQL